MTIQSIDSINFPSYILPVLGFGLLYNSYAFKHANFAPPNWKVPTQAELQLCATKIGSLNSMKSNRTYPAYNSGWTVSGGLDNFGFAALPAGYRAGINYGFQGKNIDGYFACTTPAWDGRPQTFLCGRAYSFWIINKADGASCRLLMVNSSGWTAGDILTDGDGNEYDTVKIGDQVWITSNWKCTKLNDDDETVMDENTGNSNDWVNAVIPTYCSYNCLQIIEE